MHELSLCRSIAGTVLQHAEGRPVASVRLRVGHFRQVVPETLRFCWSATSEGTPLAGSQLVVDHVPAVVSCRQCGSLSELRTPFLVCDACESVDVELTSGDEFLIESIDLSVDAD